MTHAEKLAALAAVEGTTATVTLRFPKKIGRRYECVTETVTGVVRQFGNKGGVTIGRTTTLVPYVTDVQPA